MNVTGFLIREAIKRWELRRDAAAAQFDDSLTKFKEEEKQHPTDVSAAVELAEQAVARLETAQTKYNMTVMVEVQGKKMTLCEAIKRLGGASRVEKMWRKAATPAKGRYDYLTPTTERDPTKDRAVATMLKKDMVDRANKAAVVTGSLRAAIAKGNGTEVAPEAIGLEASLLTE